jgi:hypothetical protein
MNSVTVNLTKRITLGDSKRYCPVVVSANGRIKPDYVQVNGRDEKHTGGSYYIDWTVDGKRHRVSVGTDASLAQNQRLKKETTLAAIANGFIDPEEALRNQMEPESKLLSTAIEEFIEETRLTKKPKTIYAYNLAVAYFAECLAEESGRRTLDSVERLDMLRFSSFLKTEKGLAARTCRGHCCGTGVAVA